MMALSRTLVGHILKCAMVIVQILGFLYSIWRGYPNTIDPDD